MVENLFQSCVSFGLPPSEFWNMYPIEVWWYLSSKNPEVFKDKNKDDQELLEMLEEAEDAYYKGLENG